MLELLDAAGLEIQVALWARLSEYGDNRLILASKHLEGPGLLKSIEKVLGAIREWDIAPHQEPSFLVISMRDPFLKEIRKCFGKARNVLGMRPGGMSFGDRFIEDGYVYRIS